MDNCLSCGGYRWHPTLVPADWVRSYEVAAHWYRLHGDSRIPPTAHLQQCQICESWQEGLKTRHL